MQSPCYQNQIQFILQISASKFLKTQKIGHKVLWHNSFFPPKNVLTAPTPPTPLPLFNVERVKLFGIALMAAWYIWYILKLKKSSLKLKEGGLCHYVLWVIPGL